MLNIGIIGLGFIGATHIAAWEAARRDGLAAKIVAVSDPRPERRRGDLSDVRGNIGDQQEGSAFDARDVIGYENALDLIADPNVHAVSICTPTNSHVELASAALRAGKHVLCEKPVAITTEPIERLIVVQRETGRVCMPAMCMRFWPAWSWLKERIDDRSFGEVKTATFTRLGSRPPRTDTYDSSLLTGGGHFDLHLHDVDFIHHCFGSPTRVMSTGLTSHDGLGIDQALTIYDYGDKSVVAEGGWGPKVGFAYRMRYVVNFERATADFDLTRSPALIVCRDGVEPETIDVDPLMGYDHEIRHFASAVIAGKTPVVTLDDALAVTKLMLAEIEAIKTKVPVSL